MKVTVFSSLGSAKPDHRDVLDVLNEIKNPHSSVRTKIIAIQKSESKDERNKIKKELPMIIFSGEFIKRNNESITTGSGTNDLGLG